MRSMKTFAGLLVLIGSVAGVFAGNWKWQLDAKRYKSLNMFERAQYDKAAKLFKNKNYKAAASEFEKHKVQFEDSAILSYVLFMRAYSLHNNKDRHAAIKLYNEVLDFFGDKISDAAPALYFLGIAHLDNGDVRDGMEALKEMAEDEDYQKHPLAAGAVRRLADNYWKNQEKKSAVRYWKQVVRDFSKTNADESRNARRKVIGYYVRQQQYAELVSWLAGGDSRDDARHRHWLARECYDVAWHGFDWHRGWSKYTKFNRKVRAADIKAFYDWFVLQKPWYEKRQDLWGFYHRKLQFITHRYGDTRELNTAVDETVAFIKTIKKKSDRNHKFSWMIDRLRESKRIDRARYCITKITDPPFAAYKEYEVIGHGEGKWKAAIVKLKDIRKMGNQYWADRAQGQLAWVYKDVTREYDKAIKTYREIGRPPGTLWNIQECYHRWGKLSEAIKTLNEIENMFPEEGSKAAWQKAVYYKQAGDKEKAIAQARRILKMYKKKSAASKAHQMLEDYNVDTGGGVVHER